MHIQNPEPPLIIPCCGSDPTYESLDPVSKVVNWSQHPLQDPIHKGRSVFKQSPGIIGMEVYVQWAILCRRWRHGTFYSRCSENGTAYASSDDTSCGRCNAGISRLVDRNTSCHTEQSRSGTFQSLVATTEVQYWQVRPNKQGKPPDSERKTSQYHKSI